MRGTEVTREHTVPDSALVLNLGCTFERDARFGVMSALCHDRMWIVRTIVDGRECRVTLHYSSRQNGYSAAGSYNYYPTWEYAMERDGVPALIRQIQTRSRLNGR